MADERPILVTGAGGGVGGVGRTVVSLLRERGLRVRAMVHHDDDRARALRTIGAEVVAGDLTHPGDVARALDGCGRLLFCMGVSADYLEGSVVVAAVARSLGTLEVLVNLSQMTVSQMTLTSTESLGSSGCTGSRSRCSTGRTSPWFTSARRSSSRIQCSAPSPRGRSPSAGSSPCPSAPVAAPRWQRPTSRGWSPRSCSTRGPTRTGCTS